MKKIRTEDFYRDCAKQAQKFLEKLKIDYLAALNVNDADGVHDNYTKEFIYQEKRRICSELVPYSNFFTEVERLNGKAIKGTPYQQTFNEEFEKIDSEKQSEVLTGLAYLSACEEFGNYWSEQDEIRYNRGSVTLTESDKPDIPVTLRQQVLAMKYIFEYLKVENVDATAKARFIRFIIGKDSNSNIRNGNLYDYVTDPLNVSAARKKKDLELVRKYFEDLGLTGIVEEINKALIKK